MLDRRRHRDEDERKEQFVTEKEPKITRSSGAKRGPDPAISAENFDKFLSKHNRLLLPRRVASDLLVSLKDGIYANELSKRATRVNGIALSPGGETTPDQMETAFSSSRSCITAIGFGSEFDPSKDKIQQIRDMVNFAITSAKTSAAKNGSKLAIFCLSKDADDDLIEEVINEMIDYNKQHSRFKQLSLHIGEMDATKLYHVAGKIRKDRGLERIPIRVGFGHVINNKPLSLYFTSVAFSFDPGFPLSLPLDSLSHSSSSSSSSHVESKSELKPPIDDTITLKTLEEWKNQDEDTPIILKRKFSPEVLAPHPVYPIQFNVISNSISDKSHFVLPLGIDSEYFTSISRACSSFFSLNTVIGIGNLTMRAEQDCDLNIQIKNTLIYALRLAKVSYESRIKTIQLPDNPSSFLICEALQQIIKYNKNEKAIMGYHPGARANYLRLHINETSVEVFSAAMKIFLKICPQEDCRMIVIEGGEKLLSNKVMLKEVEGYFTVERREVSRLSSSLASSYTAILQEEKRDFTVERRKDSHLSLSLPSSYSSILSSLPPHRSSDSSLMSSMPSSRSASPSLVDLNKVLNPSVGHSSWERSPVEEEYSQPAEQDPRSKLSSLVSRR